MAERMPPADFSDLKIEHIFVETSDIAYVTTTSEPEAGAISEAMSDSFFDILDFIKRNELTEAGAPISITRNFSGARLVFDAWGVTAGAAHFVARTARRGELLVSPSTHELLPADVETSVRGEVDGQQIWQLLGAPATSEVQP